MSIDENKKVALEFFSRFSANDIAGALDTMTSDATSTIRCLATWQVITMSDYRDRMKREGGNKR